jgi:hypothetical protein
VRAPLLHGRRRASLAASGAAAVIVIAVLTSGVLGRPLEARAATGANELTLASQSPAFVSSQAGVNLAIDVSSTLPTSRLSLEVTLYSAIVDRYTLQQTLSGSLPILLTPLGNPGIIPLDLKSLAWSAGKKVMIHLPVSAPDLPQPSHPRRNLGTGGVTLSIFNCTPPTCGGVYPLQVSLLEDGVGPVAGFTTFLIVTPPGEVAGTHPLHFSWVIPLGSSASISPSGTAEPDSSDLAELQALMSALGSSPRAQVSLDLFPQFVEALEGRPDPSSQLAMAYLRGLSAPGGQASILPSSFVPVDVDALVASGLQSAVSQQLSRARDVLQPVISFDTHTYAANGPLDDASLSLLENAGITRLLLPSATVQPLTQSYAQWTPTAPFLVPNEAMEAIASDPGLEQDLASSAPPALKAQEMLADLSIQYFDNPGVQQALAVESPVGQPIDPAFARALLEGLSDSPIVHAETLGDLFDSVSPGSSDTSPTKRLLKTVQPPSADLVPSAPIQTAQQNLAALASVLPGPLHPRGSVPLADLILMAEGAGESPPERSAYLSTIAKQSGVLASLVSLPFGRTITVTSLQSRIPISIISNARTPFMAELSVSSPGLLFPKGHILRIKVYPHTNIVPILLSARTSGDFSLRLTLATTTGFIMESGDMTIRSTAISGVAVGLSIGAIVFLFVWWSRAILTKRRKKHKLRGAALAAGAIPGGRPEA